MTTPPEQCKEYSRKYMSEMNDLTLDLYVQIVNEVYKEEKEIREISKTPCGYCYKPIGKEHFVEDNGSRICLDCHKLFYLTPSHDLED